MTMNLNASKPILGILSMLLIMAGLISMAYSDRKMLEHARTTNKVARKITTSCGKTHVMTRKPGGAKCIERLQVKGDIMQKMHKGAVSAIEWHIVLCDTDADKVKKACEALKGQ